LSDLITNTIGNQWVTNLYDLKKLENYVDNQEFLDIWQQAKWNNKLKLVNYISENYNININPHSIFDTQIKRIHEYKRQLLNVIHIVALYNRIKENPHAEFVPRTMIFGGKAAPGYFVAKRIIKLIHSISDIINNDPDVGDKLKVVFLKNYSVTLAELIIPATDLSEQISTAGYEASGTGNMKFQLNGALTIGTLDGANIEMMEEMGRENMYIFGLSSEEVVNLHNNNYNPSHYYESSHELKNALDLIKSNYFNVLEPGIFDELLNMLMYGGDKYCLLADFESYQNAHKFAAEEFLNKNLWTKKAILNVARVGKFSSDRTIKQYADDIWKISSLKINTTNGKT
jgi:starch phosphorylase